MTKETESFEGRKIDCIDVKLRGNAGNDQLNQAMHLDDEVLFVGRARISRIQHHEHDKRGLIRTQTAEVVEAHMLANDDDVAFVDVETLLHTARAARDEALDALLGRSALPFDPETGERTDDPPKDA